MTDAERIILTRLKTKQQVRKYRVKKKDEKEAEIAELAALETDDSELKAMREKIKSLNQVLNQSRERERALAKKEALTVVKEGFFA